jgi:hypothetical protein
VLAAGGVAAGPVLEAEERWRLLLGGLGAAGVLAFAAILLLRWNTAIPWPLTLLGAEYAVSLLLADEGFDGLAPLYGAGLLAAAEFAYEAVDRGWFPPGEQARRLALSALLAVGASAVGALVLAVAAVPLTGGVLLEGIGVAAAVGALLVVAALARRHAP